MSKVHLTSRQLFEQTVATDFVIYNKFIKKKTKSVDSECVTFCKHIG